MALRVLMLGWEFPPFITGGLGTACYGLTKALDRQGVEVSFVLPKSVPSESASHVRLVSPGSIIERVQPKTNDTANAPVPAKPHATSRVGLQPTASTASSTAALQPTEAQLTSSEREAWTRIVEEFNSTRFIELPNAVGAFDGVYESRGVATPNRVAESVRMMREAGWSIERIRTLAKAGAFPELTRDPVDHALATALPETADRPKEAASARGADAADYSGDLLGMADRYARFVVDATRGLDFDVIHAHDWLTYPAGLAVQKLSGKPLLVHVHSTEFDRSGETPHQQIYNIERRGMHGATRAIAVSMLTKNVCINRYGVDASKIDVVYNGVDLNPADAGVQPIHSKDKIVLYFGRITMQKGPEYFIQAAKKVLEYMDNVKFVVAGSGDQAQRMIEMAAQLGIGNKVLFTGFLRGRDIARVFAMADLYVMPSVSEPFGIAPLEAMSHNVPVLISKSSGVSEVLMHALKVDFWDIEDMADKIIAVLRHPPLSRQLVEHGSFEIRGINWDGAATRTIRCYNRAIAALGAGQPAY
ncbi:MAG: glycosyltransferase [Limnohabitans sp.]|jgi:glycogen(starch) synthase|nr:glycosyltransferase [Limnohabitans sp.]